MRALFFAIVLASTACLPVIPDGGPRDTGDPDPGLTCDTVVADLWAEADAIRSCEVPADCGQVLRGTSCGCTRDWVARVDADPTRFWEIAELGQHMSCELPFSSPCDCPEADGFDCVDGQCQWAPPPPPPPAQFSDCRGAQGAPVDLLDMRVMGDDIVVDVAYSGGCAEHDFVVCWPDQSFAERVPPLARLELLHLTPGDPCDAYPQERIRVDLAPLRQAYQEMYGGRAGTMSVSLGRLRDTYSFR